MGWEKLWNVIQDFMVKIFLKFPFLLRVLFFMCFSILLNNHSNLKLNVLILCITFQWNFEKMSIEWQTFILNGLNFKIFESYLLTEVYIWPKIHYLHSKIHKKLQFSANITAHGSVQTWFLEIRFKELTTLIWWYFIPHVTLFFFIFTTLFFQGNLHTFWAAPNLS